MKKFILLLAVVAFTSMMAFAQKTYEMVIEKTDGSSVVINTEDIIRTYFRERTDGGDDNQKVYLSCPDNHHPHIIDLGLPSGTKWACCNVDTDYPESQSPTNYGGYFAWGETRTKDTYDWSTYIHCDGSGESCHNIGSDIAGTQYDVAHVKWGDSWKMPCARDFDELIKNCTKETVIANNIKGTLFTGTNGNKVFFPFVGFKDPNLQYYNVRGYYWSSECNPQYSTNSYYFRIENNRYDTGENGNYKSEGYSIRPIYNPQNEIFATLEGTWEGDMKASLYNSGRYYEASYTQIHFLRDPFRYSSGDGYWIDYYQDYGFNRDYVANHIEWTVYSNRIKVYFVEDDSFLDIYDWSLDASHFTGYIELADGSRHRFSLRHVNSPNWDSFQWGR